MNIYEFRKYTKLQLFCRILQIFSKKILFRIISTNNVQDKSKDISIFPPQSALIKRVILS